MSWPSSLSWMRLTARISAVAAIPAAWSRFSSQRRHSTDCKPDSDREGEYSPPHAGRHEPSIHPAIGPARMRPIAIEYVIIPAAKPMSSTCRGLSVFLLDKPTP